MSDVQAAIERLEATKPSTGPTDYMRRIVRDDDLRLVLEAAKRVPDLERDQVVSTVEELEALPVESVIRDAHGYILERLSAKWYRPALSRGYPLSNPSMLPARVLYTPEVSR